MTTTAAAILQDARKLLEEHWVNRPPSGDEHCMLTAIGLGMEDYGAYAEAKEALVKSTGTVYLAAWNDASDRTLAEVLAAFDKAIELAKADVHAG